VSAGAWAVGLNHWQGSPRCCELEVAEEIGAALKRRCEVVGVFVNATLDEVARAAEREELTMVQLHGEEGPQFCAEVARRTGCKVIKAFRVRSGAELQAAEPYRTDLHLLDAHREDVPGGTGESFDWEIAAAHKGPPVLLAGGLRPDNVAEAIAIAHPYAVDVASGVESAPGVKDPELVRELIEAVAAADPVEADSADAGATDAADAADPADADAKRSSSPA